MEKKSNSNRKLFAGLVLPTFVCAYTHNSSVTNVYEQFIERLNQDTDPDNRARNEERRKILENCRDLFKDIPTKKEIDREKWSNLIDKDLFNEIINFYNSSL